MVASWDWTLHKFRLALAESLREEGYDITFVCADGKYVSTLQERGFRWVEWASERKRLNPFAEVKALLELAEIYARERPDLIHHDTIKPNLYGPLAVWLNQQWGRVPEPPVVIDAFMGLGFVFSEGALPFLLRRLTAPFLRFGINQPYVHLVFSNESDQQRLRAQSILKHDRVDTLMSEFVDTNVFKPPEPNGESTNTERDEGAPVVLMAVRLLWAKGVGEFARAARMLKRQGVDARFWLAGEPDKDSAGAVPEKQLREWENEGILECLGYRTDMPELMGEADVAVLPTKYNEGMPRFLVEAASSGLPVVTTDMEACRLVVRDGANGKVVAGEDVDQLAEAIKQLVTDPALRTRMGHTARDIAVREFDAQTGMQDWHQLYARLLPA